MQTVLLDLRLALRRLRVAPGFGILVIAILTLGIGANTAVFSVVRGILLRPLPYRDADQLIVLHHATATDVDVGFSVLESTELRGAITTFDVAEEAAIDLNITDERPASRLTVGVVSGNYFQLFGTRAVLGRVFTATDDSRGAVATVVLTHSLWSRRWGADSSVVGRTVQLGGRPHQVIGILPDVRQFPAGRDAYVTVASAPLRNSAFWMNERNFRPLTLVGRLHAGTDYRRAVADVARVVDRMHRDNPRFYPAAARYAIGIRALEADVTRSARPTLLLLAATSAFVLLIACANTATLMYSRVVRRTRELAVRSALGASLGRLAQQLAIETSLLSFAGGALGTVAAYAGLGMLRGVVSQFSDRAGQVSVDGIVLLFTLVVSMLTGILTGLVPLLAIRRRLTSGLQRGASRTSTGSRALIRMDGAFVIGQFAATLVLLAGAGVMVRTLIALRHVDPGFDPANVVTMQVSLDPVLYPNASARALLHQTAVDRLRELPSVRSAAVSMTFPFDGSGTMDSDLTVDGYAASPDRSAPHAEVRAVSPKYFETLRVPIVRGRDFGAGDREGSPAVAIVNLSMARRYWGATDPVGRRVAWRGMMGGMAGTGWITIVGVAGDVRQHGLRTSAPSEIYVPHAQQPMGGFLIVRTAVPVTGAMREIEGVLRGVFPGQPITDVRVVSDVLAKSEAPANLTATLLLFFAIIGVALSATSIGGSMAFAVSERTRELGIRSALGATPRSLLVMIARNGLLLAVSGTAAGVGAALALTRLLSAWLFAVRPDDPLTFIVVSVGLIGVGLLSSWIPAWRASTTSPLIALHRV